MSYGRILAGPLAGLRALISLLYGAWLSLLVVVGYMLVVGGLVIMFFRVLRFLAQF